MNTIDIPIDVTMHDVTAITVERHPYSSSEDGRAFEAIDLRIQCGEATPIVLTLFTTPNTLVKEGKLVAGDICDL